MSSALQTAQVTVVAAASAVIQDVCSVTNRVAGLTLAARYPRGVCVIYRQICLAPKLNNESEKDVTSGCRIVYFLNDDIFTHFED